jgi:hypothetical protein
MQIECIDNADLRLNKRKKNMKNQFYSTFNIAGFTYWDGLSVMGELKVGTELTLEAEPTNGHDPNAVKILYKGTMLGYIPRDSNKEISKFLQLGYTELFSAWINRVSPELHTEEQIGVTVRINKKRDTQIS